MLSVLHIATSPNGGAGIAVGRLHGALRAAGMQSRMAVSNRGGVVGDILELPAVPPLRPSVSERLEARRLQFERRHSSKNVSPKLAYFSDDRVPGPNRLAGRPEADVLNLHWVANFLDYGKFFSSVRQGQPLVWTLHDMAPMTGGCHYAMDCEQFTEQCGACPLLGSTQTGDLTRRIHSRKKAALAKLLPDSTRVVAPSKWLAGEAVRSSLLGRFQVDVIPNGLDVETFIPRDPNIAREVLGLPQDRRIILFAADSVADYRKGMDLLLSAIEDLDSGHPVTLVSMGGGAADVPEGSVALDRINNARLMSFVYSAADIFVLPTRAEAFGQVLAEAMACGTPSVSFRVGGVPDVVREGQAGLLAQQEDVTSLRQCIVSLLNDGAMRERMSRAGREIAVNEYADTAVAAQYVTVYEELIEASKVLAGRFFR